MNPHDPPDRIWLQVDPENDLPSEITHLPAGYVTWCEHRVNDSDAEYRLVSREELARVISGEKP